MIFVGNNMIHNSHVYTFCSGAHTQLNVSNEEQKQVQLVLLCRKWFRIRYIRSAFYFWILASGSSCVSVCEYMCVRHDNELCIGYFCMYIYAERGFVYWVRLFWNMPKRKTILVSFLLLRQMTKVSKYSCYFCSCCYYLRRIECIKYLCRPPLLNVLIILFFVGNL